MSAMRKWIRKVITGIAAFLLTVLQAMGSVDMSYMMMPYGYSYSWTDHGIRATMLQEEMRQREEQRLAQEHLYTARLEGEVHEDQLRTVATRERAEGEKAAS